MKILRKLLEFEWDTGNRGKNWAKHRVTDEECEEVFFDVRKKVLSDVFHSHKEKRYILIGQTKKQRGLFLVFTIRNYKVRIISCRNLNKREKYLYEKEA